MIGIFDSGLGGLTVVREVEKQLPGFRIVYFGDTAHLPYGNKSATAVRRYSVANARYLEKQGAKCIIIACNTASAVAVEAVRAAVKVPVFEVVTPAVMVASETPVKRIGLIGTRGTVASGVYDQWLKKRMPKAKLFKQACPLFVPLVEEGWAGRPETASIAKTYLSALKSRGIESLILGCTHYPLLRRVIQKAVGSHVRLVDPAEATVAVAKKFLLGRAEFAAQAAKKSGRRTQDIFAVSDLTANYREQAERFLGRKIKLIEVRFE